jgi:hypothetical protein
MFGSASAAKNDKSTLYNAACWPCSCLWLWLFGYPAQAGFSIELSGPGKQHGQVQCQLVSVCVELDYFHGLGSGLSAGNCKPLVGCRGSLYLRLKPGDSSFDVIRLLLLPALRSELMVELTIYVLYYITAINLTILVGLAELKSTRQSDPAHALPPSCSASGQGASTADFACGGAIGDVIQVCCCSCCYEGAAD